MADDQMNAGTTTLAEQAPVAPQQAQPGTARQEDEVTTLRSRNAGLDAKVSSLMEQLSAANKARETMEAKLADYEKGIASADEAARAQVARLEAELADVRKQATTSALAAKYPESHALFGEAIASMSEEVLAAGEARLKGVASESNEPPVPVANTQGRMPAPEVKSFADMSLDELKDHAKREFSNITWDDISHQSD